MLRTRRTRLATLLRGLAHGRIALGVLALTAPAPAARRLGVTPTPALTYLARICGARAIALGVGYLSSSPSARRTWQRLALLVDLSDTVTGAGHLVRADLPRGTARLLVALTGSYLAIGATQFAHDLVRAGQEAST